MFQSAFQNFSKTPQVSSFDDPYEAALSVVAQSYGRWLDHETRTDDITMIILQFVGLDQQAPPVAPE